MMLEPLGPAALHVAVDVQRLFVEPSPWQAPAMAAIVPNVARLARALPTLFTRFVPAASAVAAPRRWRRYYERWREVTLDRLDPAMVELVDALSPRPGIDRVVDKPTYSLFECAEAVRGLEATSADTLLFSGGETDVCVLATLLGAVDRGYRVVVVTDAVASFSAEGHRAVLDAILPRLPEQVELATTDAVLAALERS